HRATLRYWTEIRIAHCATRAGAGRTGPRRSADRHCGIARAQGDEMSSRLTEIITASDPAVRNQSLDTVCRGVSLKQLRDECAALDAFRRERENLYERVRA